jgi:hypothetical protein
LPFSIASTLHDFPRRHAFAYDFGFKKFFIKNTKKTAISLRKFYGLS